MTNQLKLKSESLVDYLNRSGLIKDASQEITHKTLQDQTNLGKEQTKDLHEGVEGVLADTAAAKNTSKDTIPDLPGVQNLNASGEEGLRAEGRSIELQTTDGCPSGTPAQEAKKMATDYRTAIAQLVAAKREQVKQASAEEPTITTGSEVMTKFAALSQESTEADIKDAEESLMKLASTNPAFNVIRDRIIMRKMAEDIDALAEAEGISPEEAAAELQAASEADPAMGAELEDEATGEAVADLAGAEAATGDLMAGIDEMAANASANLGVEVTPDDIMAAADEVVAMAEEQGVEPEAILQAAIEEMQGGEGEDISEEDMAAAEQILSQAAEQGISPEEVIQALADDLGGGEDSGEEAEAEAAPTEKVASVQQKQASTDRAAYVQYLRHQK